MRFVLPIIVFSQFCGVSLWFAGNGIMSDLITEFALRPSALGHLTSAVQLGFITGTLLFALLTVADRFSPSVVFLVCSVFGAAVNLGMLLSGHDLISLVTVRFLTGFFLAGIYPVGMKIASDYYDKGLGKSMGYLLGALVVGTAFPHLLKDVLSCFSWRSVVIATSGLAAIGGGLLFLLVPDGPYRKAGPRLRLGVIKRIFTNKTVRGPALGYFGHMWELYAFWAFVPVLLAAQSGMVKWDTLNVPLCSFAVIAIGGLACVLGGYVSQRWSERKVAMAALMISGVCCLISPWMIGIGNNSLFLFYLLIWGFAVIPDSPMFSTLVARHAAPDIRGTSLTMMNSIGFTITIISIQLLNILYGHLDLRWLFLILAPGPILGLLAMMGMEKGRLKMD